MTRNSKVGWFAAAAALALTAGCQHQNNPAPSARGDFFTTAAQSQQVRNILSAQAAVGAHNDATLRTAHFDGTELNSLGEEKLELMLAAHPSSQPLLVYLDMPQNQGAAQQRASVVDYLKGRGLDESRIRLENGPNPNSSGNAAAAMNALQSLETPREVTAPQGAPTGHSTTGTSVAPGPMSP